MSGGHRSHGPSSLILLARYTGFETERVELRGNRPCWSPSESGDGGGTQIDADALVGELLVNRYRIEETVAQGPVATVFRARDAESDRDVAVKLLESRIDPEGETARSMVADVEKAADIQHPSLVPVTEIGLHQGEAIFVVEPFVAAETVAERLADDGPFKPRVAMRIAREVFDGLTEPSTRTWESIT